ncbi:MAG: amidohydrolase family protein [Acidimicrobiales bacterium]
MGRSRATPSPPCGRRWSARRPSRPGCRCSTIRARRAGQPRRGRGDGATPTGRVHREAALRRGQVRARREHSGFTARLTEPYLGDRPNGLWLIPSAQLADWIRPVVAAGLLLHVHCNGDEAVDVMLDAFTDATGGAPPPDHRTTVQHSQLTRLDQYERMADLGLCANLFSNHFWYWGDQHVEQTVGPERAARMNAAATARGLGIPLSIHSDASVTPLGPLHVAWCAANRRTANGRVLGADERLTAEQALHAITLGAAYQLRMDHEVGSITVGKRADLAVLDADPIDVGPEGLREIGVVATVLGGTAQLVG